jgi:two-component system response regulator YesN
VYRVLIVDDEEPVLDSYEFMLKSTDDFLCAGKARTGYEALKLIHELEPHLVFMDINIPGVDGLGVIVEVHPKFPAMDFIISTAYERFDLAQRAIPLGVFAYLVKPVTKKIFFETLNKFREHDNARFRNAAILTGLEGPENPAARNRGAVGRDPLPSAERQFLRKTIWEAIPEEQWEQYRRRFNLPSDKGMVCILELEEREAFRGKLVAEKLSYRHYCLHDSLLYQEIFFVSGDISRISLEKQLIKILEELIPAPVSRHYGIGELYRGPELYRSCGEARDELQRKRNHTDVLLRQRRHLVQLRQKIGIADPAEIKKLFTRLWAELFADHDFTLAKAKMVSVFMFLVDDCTGYFRGQSEDPPLFSIAEDIMKITDMAEWEDWAANAFDALLRQITLRRSGSFPLPLVKAVEYVHGHYAEGLQLSAAAAAARVSPAYLSRLFSEHLKTNFIDYLTELRVEKAARLLRESRMNIKEIAYRVGYQDPNYFSKIFRKVTGQLPHQVRGEAAE